MRSTLRKPPHPEDGTVTAKMVVPEFVDTRVIKSIGRYDVEGELAAEEYPADFVRDFRANFRTTRTGTRPRGETPR